MGAWELFEYEDILNLMHILNIKLDFELYANTHYKKKIQYIR